MFVLEVLSKISKNFLPGSLRKVTISIVFIAGNHDWVCTKDVKSLIPSNITYLFDETIVIENLHIYGTPWQPIFYNWAFNLPEAELQLAWDKIPTDTDILLTHCPPLRILDKGENPIHCGAASLLEKVKSLKLKTHIFGHIHSGLSLIHI